MNTKKEKITFLKKITRFDGPWKNRHKPRICRYRRTGELPKENKEDNKE